MVPLNLNRVLNFRYLMPVVCTCLLVYGINGGCVRLPKPDTANDILPEEPTTTITVVVTFASTPTSATATLATLKYNKQATFQFEVDDNSAVILDPFIVCMGGTASNGVTYPGKTFSDGCGNQVNWRGGLAVNARGNYNNNDIWQLANRMSAAQAGMLVKNNWSILNHGYYHEPTGNYRIMASAMASAAANDLLQNVPHTYDKLLGEGGEYIMRAVVNPSNHPGFTRAADSLNLLGVTSTGASDGYTGYPTYTSLQAQTGGANFAQEEKMPPGFVQMLRTFQDTWNTANVNYLKRQFDDMMANCGPNKHLTMRLGTHTATLSGILDLLGHADSVDADKVWFVGFHEYLEYREVKRLCVMSQKITSNVMSITLDLNALPTENRFRDMSLLVSGGAITNVYVNGADRFSYNADTGLINIFKRKKTGFKRK